MAVLELPQAGGAQLQEPGQVQVPGLGFGAKRAVVEGAQAAARSQGAAGPAQAGLQGAGRAGRGAAAPDRVHEHVPGARVPREHQQHRDKLSLAAGQVYLNPVTADGLQRA